MVDLNQLRLLVLEQFGWNVLALVVVSLISKVEQLQYTIARHKRQEKKYNDIYSLQHMLDTSVTTRL